MVHVSLSTVDGGFQEWTKSDSFYRACISLREAGLNGKAIIQKMISKDWKAVPKGMRLSGTLEDGSSIDEYVSYS